MTINIDTLNEGDKVETVFGNVVEILSINNNLILAYNGGNGEQYHISKLAAVVSQDTPLSSYDSTMHSLMQDVRREGRKHRLAVQTAKSIVR